MNLLGHSDLFMIKPSCFLTPFGFNKNQYSCVGRPRSTLALATIVIVWMSNLRVRPAPLLTVECLSDYCVEGISFWFVDAIMNPILRSWLYGFTCRGLWMSPCEVVWIHNVSKCTSLESSSVWNESSSGEVHYEYKELSLNCIHKTHRPIQIEGSLRQPGQCSVGFHLRLALACVVSRNVVWLFR